MCKIQENLERKFVFVLTVTEELKKKEEQITDGEATFVKTSMKRERVTTSLSCSNEAELQDWRRTVMEVAKRRAASAK